MLFPKSQARHEEEKKKEVWTLSMFSCGFPANAYKKILILQVVPHCSLSLGKARGLSRWENLGYLYTAKACS